MTCEECKEIGNQVMDMFISEDYTLDEAKIVLLNVLDSINHIIKGRSN